MAGGRIPIDQLTPEAKRKLRQQNPDAFPPVDRRPARDIDVYADKPDTPVQKSRWERIKEGIQSGGEKVKDTAGKGVGKFQEFSKNHPINSPKKGLPPKKGVSPRKEPNKANWEKPKQGRITSKDVYENGVLKERIHYGPARPAKQPQPQRRGRRGDPLGGIGSGMNFSDFLPSNQGIGLGGMMPYPGFADPTGRSAPPRPRKSKKHRRQPKERDEPFDYLDHINRGFPKTWEGRF